MLIIFILLCKSAGLVEAQVWPDSRLKKDGSGLYVHPNKHVLILSTSFAFFRENESTMDKNISSCLDKNSQKMILLSKKDDGLLYKGGGGVRLI